MYFKNLPSNSRIIQFNELDDSVKDFAVSEFLAFEIESHKINIQKAKNDSLHSRINNKNHIRKLVLNGERIARLKSDRQHCEKVIAGNLCGFLSNGVYVTYTR